jgi:hypothetical protein
MIYFNYKPKKAFSYFGRKPPELISLDLIQSNLLELTGNFIVGP